MLESLVQNCWLFSGREALSVLLPALPPRELALCACSQSPGPASTEVGLGVSQFCSMLSSMKNLIFVNVWQGQHCQIKNECQQIFWKSLKSVFFCILHVISRLIYESYLILLPGSALFAVSRLNTMCKPSVPGQFHVPGNERKADSEFTRKEVGVVGGGCCEHGAGPSV